MRILLVIDDMHPRSGGPPVVVAGSAIALAARGHAVTILSAVQPGDDAAVRARWSAVTDVGVTLNLRPPLGAASLFGSPDATLVQAIEHANVVHIHGVWAPILILSGRVARQHGIPYFVSTHGVFDHRAMTRIKRKWAKKRLAVALFGIRGFLERAAGVVFGSEAEAEQSWKASSDMRLTFVPNGADATLGTTMPTAGDLARLHAVAPATAGWARTILCRSRIHEEKGIDLLVQAFNSVAPDFPGVGLLIAGLRQDDAYQQRVAALIAGGPVSDRIVLTTDLTGPTSQFLYRAADIFAMPSLAEGFSMGLVEGLANGRPLLITRYCHMPVVAAAGAGVVVESTVGSIAGGLREMLDGRHDLPAMGAAGRRLFETRFTWDHVAAQLEGEYVGARVGTTAA